VIRVDPEGKTENRDTPETDTPDGAG